MRIRRKDNINKIETNSECCLNKSAAIRVNDVFDELVDQNRELEKQIKLFIEFKSFFGEICNKLISNLNEQELHRLKTFDKQFKQLFDCQESQTIESNVKTVENKTNTNKKCENVSKDFKTKNYNKLRLKLKNRFKCSENNCFLSFNTEDLLEEHIKYDHQLTKTGPFICDFIGCGLVLKDKTALRKHERIHSSKRLMRCHWDGCHYSSDDRKNYLCHLRRHEAALRYVCSGYEGCHRRFLSERQLRTHIEISHIITEKAFKCTVDDCSKAFKAEFLLKKHMKRIHTFREKNIFCDVFGCQFRTYTKASLVSHKANCHSDDRPYRCEHEGCQKAYKTKDCLKYHHLSHSKDSLPLLKCLEPNCDKAFKYPDSLRRHMKNGHSNVRIPCYWPGCDYTAATALRMKYHIVVHKPERNYVCLWPDCGKSFKHQKYLNEHTAIHKNDKRYVCGWPGCQYRCCVKSNLTKHEKIHIKNVN